MPWTGTSRLGVTTHSTSVVHGKIASVVDAATHDRSGGVAVLFAMMLMPLLILTGMGIDYGRAVHLRSTFQSACDAAAEAALPHLNRPLQDIKNLISATIDANVPESERGKDFQFHVADDKRSISITLETVTKTPLLSFAGVPEQKLAVQSVAHAPKLPAAIPLPAGVPTGTQMPEVTPEDVKRTMELLERLRPFLGSRMSPEEMGRLREMLGG